MSTMTACIAAVLATTTLAVAQPRSPQPRPTPASPAAPAPPIVLRGGKLLTVTKGIIENGVIVMENGKITAIGAAGSVNVPRNGRVIDAAGMTIYPGLIDSQTQLGLTEISAVDMTNDLVEPSDQITPHMRVADAFHAETELIPVTRVNGVTNAIVSPTTRNTLPGQMSFIQLDGKDADEMIKVKDIGMPLNFTGDQRRREGQGGISRTFPATRMGMAAQLRQAFIDAQDYAQKWADYERKKNEPAKADDKSKPDRNPPPKRDLKLEALLPYLEGKKPVLLTAEEANDIQVALKLAQEFNLKVILARATYAHNVMDAIAATKLPVIVGSIYATPKNDARYDTQFKLPAELHKRGVKIAFASYDAHDVRNLPYAAGYAVAYGLPWEEALKAVTINPAQIWGVETDLGSLEVGKTANVVVANGDPLDHKTDVKRVFIAGREIPMVSRHTRLRDEYMGR